jgi:phospholipid/cholesterol/gamma-HCH transport system substrate-binding protein
VDAELKPAARRRRMTEETRHILVGALVFLALIMLFTFSTASNGGAIGAYHVIAKFNTAEGVYVDSPVRLSGVDVGRVTAMAYDSESQRVILTMEVRPEIELPLDSLAIVTSEGMLGSRFIRLDPGGEIELLAEGDEIEFTQDSILFEELLAKIIITVEQRRLARKAAKKQAGENAETSGSKGTQ